MINHALNFIDSVIYIYELIDQNWLEYSLVMLGIALIIASIVSFVFLFKK